MAENFNYIKGYYDKETVNSTDLNGISNGGTDIPPEKENLG